MRFRVEKAGPQWFGGWLAFPDGADERHPLAWYAIEWEEALAHALEQATVSEACS